MAMPPASKLSRLKMMLSDKNISVPVLGLFFLIFISTTAANAPAAVYGILPEPAAGTIPWMDIIGLFVFLAGFVIGLGAVTVIDMHGFLGMKSPYWTESTIRAHKVTKPLIWLGYILALIGGCIFYRENGLSGVAAFHALAAVFLFFNGLFLSFWVSPRLLQREREGRAQELLPASWQAKIAISFVVSFTGWWGSLFLLVWQLMINR